MLVLSSAMKAYHHLYPRRVHILPVLLLVLEIFSLAFGQCSRLHFNSSPVSLPNSPKIRKFERRKNVICPHSRSLDGTCTSRPSRRCDNRLWGSAGTAHFSYIPGHSSIRPVRTHLPSARLISNVISTQSEEIPNGRGLREFFVFFGEFLDHNIIGTKITNDQPFHIPIPEQDGLLSNFSDGVLEFNRAQRVKVIDELELGSHSVERAMTTISAAIDLTTVYGPDEQRLKQLRKFRKGKLRVSSGDFMPFNTPQLENEPSHSADFFLAGDIRANDHPVLTSLHTIFLREHNYWCKRLADAYPALSDEKLFQKARKINIAQMQKIVYEEFIPAITGRTLPTYKGHKRCVNPAISDVFSTAAYRIGHTLVGNNVQRRGAGMSDLPSLDFSQMFFRPARTFLSHGMETFLRGAIDKTAQEVDTLVSSSLRNFLFANVPEFSHFVDLIAINIQRGRDNALPGYNGVRGMFGLPLVTSFSEITSSLTIQNKLSTLYNSPDDIDPWIGLMAEDHAPGASMGRTAMKIWETEFARIRDADRFFYLRRNLFTQKIQKDFPEVRLLAEKPRKLMRELLLRHTQLTEDEVPADVFRKSPP